MSCHPPHTPPSSTLVLERRKSEPWRVDIASPGLPLPWSAHSTLIRSAAPACSFYASAVSTAGAPTPHERVSPCSLLVLSLPQFPPVGCGWEFCMYFYHETSVCLQTLTIKRFEHPPPKSRQSRYTSMAATCTHHPTAYWQIVYGFI